MTESGPYGTLWFTLNPAINRRDALQVSAQDVISYAFDNNDNTTSITQDAATTSISYDGLNRPTTRTLPSGVQTTWAYDSHGFVSSILSNNGNIDGHAFTRDAVGNVTVNNREKLSQF
jgi:YD repeat-containing protein